MPLDTSPEAKATQLEVLGRLTAAERLRLAFELSDATRKLAFAGLKARMPGAPEPELVRTLIERGQGPPELPPAPPSD